jgi:hypothetical protein
MTKEQYLRNLKIELFKIKLEKDRNKKAENERLLKQVTITGEATVSI